MSRMSVTQKDIAYILDVLPHRYPFVMVDRVLDFTADKAITALKQVTINEPYFPGHFPGFPVMPGVMQLEALAQTSGLLIMLSAGIEKRSDDYYFLFAGMDNCRFRRSVVPGDSLKLHAELQRHKSHLYRFAAHATVDEQTVCEAELTIGYRQK